MGGSVFRGNVGMVTSIDPAALWPLFADAAHGVCLVDGSGKVTRANDTLATLLGLPAAALAGGDIAALLVPDRPEVLRAGLDAVGGGEQPNWTGDFPQPRSHQAGGMKVEIRPLGPAEMLVEVMETAPDRFAQALRYANTCFAFAGTDGRLLEVNQAMADLLGESPEALVGRHFADISHPEDIEREVALVAALGRGEIDHYRLEKRYVTADGRTPWVEITVSALRDAAGTPHTFAAVAIDITDRRQAEAELATKTAELERRNADLQQFAYAVSHDFQEPLRMISAYLQLLQRRTGDKLDDEEREFIGFAVDGAQRLHGLIHDLLNFSRVTTQSRRMGPVDLGEVLETVRANLGLAIEDAGGTVAIDGPLPVVHGDSAQLSLLFQNLVGNALKYRHEARPPTIRITTSTTNPHPVIAVADNGIGIAPEHAEDVFKVFRRLHGPDRYPGTGMGLAIARRIVDRHGGRIWLESEPGQGTTFLISLPGPEG